MGKAIKLGVHNYRLLHSIATKEGCSMDEAVTKLFNVFRGSGDKVTQEMVDTNSAQLAALGRWYLEIGREKYAYQVAETELLKHLLKEKK